MQFATYLAQKGLAWQSIKTYLAGTRHFLMLQDLAAPFQDEHLPRLQLLLQGIKRISSQTSTPHPHLPITPSILRQLFEVLNHNLSDPDATMLWAPMNLCFFGFLRSVEICCPSETSYDPSWHLCLRDVSIDSITRTNTIYVTIKASKNDPFQLGVTITVSRTADTVCPVKALLPYLAIRGTQAGPLFQFASGGFLTRAKFVATVRQLLAATKFNPELYSGHSFCIGAATTAASVGLQDNVIQTLGR